MIPLLLLLAILSLGRLFSQPPFKYIILFTLSSNSVKSGLLFTPVMCEKSESVLNFPDAHTVIKVVDQELDRDLSTQSRSLAETCEWLMCPSLGGKGI